MPSILLLGASFAAGAALGVEHVETKHHLRWHKTSHHHVLHPDNERMLASETLKQLKVVAHMGPPIEIQFDKRQSLNAGQAYYFQDATYKDPTRDTVGLPGAKYVQAVVEAQLFPLDPSEEEKATLRDQREVDSPFEPYFDMTEGGHFLSTLKTATGDKLSGTVILLKGFINGLDFNADLEGKAGKDAHILQALEEKIQAASKDDPGVSKTGKGVTVAWDGDSFYLANQKVLDTAANGRGFTDLLLHVALKFNNLNFVAFVKSEELACRNCDYADYFSESGFNSDKSAYGPEQAGWNTDLFKGTPWLAARDAMSSRLHVVVVNSGRSLKYTMLGAVTTLVSNALATKLHIFIAGGGEAVGIEYELVANHLAKNPETTKELTYEVYLTNRPNKGTLELPTLFYGDTTRGADSNACKLAGQTFENNANGGPVFDYEQAGLAPPHYDQDMGGEKFPLVSKGVLTIVEKNCELAKGEASLPKINVVPTPTMIKAAEEE